jgi:hypothetical protein
MRHTDHALCDRTVNVGDDDLEVGLPEKDARRTLGDARIGREDGKGDRIDAFAELELLELIGGES